MKALANASYATLRNKIRETLLLGQRKIFARGRIRPEHCGGDEAKVRTYWETGIYINQHIRINDGRADYGKKVVLRFPGDLKIDDSVLRRCAEFADLFPDYEICAARHKLTWAHYRALITVEDERQRLVLADQAVAEDWSSRELEIRIRNLRWNKRIEASDGKPPSLLPVPVLGTFYTYKVIAPETVHSVFKQLLLDLGFSCRLEMEIFQACRLSVDAIVTSAKDAKGRYTLKEVRPKSIGHSRRRFVDHGPSAMDLLYTYKAFVQRFIDADTFHVEFRLGFGQLREETIRLRGIDCPEINTPEGRAAKRFVERELAHCEFITVPTPINFIKDEIGAILVTIDQRKIKTRTVKSAQTRKEKWGRYLGDVFYIDKTGKQQYLNNLLLKKGHAVRVRE